MKKNYNPKSLENLKSCRPGETHNPNGRPKKMVNAIKGLPADMQEKVYGVLAFALTLPDETAAKEYLKQQEGQLGKYGFVLQICIKQLTREGWGFNALMDIMDRLYGRPKQQTDVQMKGDSVNIIVNSEEEKNKLLSMDTLEI